MLTSYLRVVKQANIQYSFMLFSLLFMASMIYPSGQSSYVTTKKSDDVFILSESGYSRPLLVSSHDFPGVIRVLKHLQTDIENVSDVRPELFTDEVPDADHIVIAGTLGKSQVINLLIAQKKLNIYGLTGRRETHIITTIKNPFPNVKMALVIVGSDKRGTIYGIFDLAEEIGVSPWYWWADVPVKKKSEIYIKPGRYTDGEPRVKYRGIFINDEAPAMSGWSLEKYGTVQFNHELYQHVFELILRLKGNFLWPAMWGRAFYDDDPVNPQLAEEYGVVIGTSHHEPMMRAHVEWERYGSGPWNYEENAERLREFWREGIERMNSNESIITLAMRGDGDMAMSPDANVSLLQRIVKDQREIIADVTGKDITTIPQVWALYKEVQEYYDKGMRVPDDVTLLLCDDNWGNVRKLPNPADKPGAGGYGMYYHYDFVGGPRNYKWLNTNQIERVWEQMHLSYEYGVDRIWIVNVGDIKPMEFPISFFLDYAWNPDLMSADDLPAYYKNWAVKQFGENYYEDIAEILSKYTKYNARRKPEMLSPDTYSLINFREAENVVSDYNRLHWLAKDIYNKIAPEYKDAFYELVLHPVEACSNLNELYFTTAKNRMYAKQGRSLTNQLAERVKELYNRDASITHYYNKILADGKWDHMMDQVHIGYTYWQQPDEQSMPDVEKINIQDEAEMGVAVEGSDEVFTGGDEGDMLPEFDQFNRQSYYIEIFNMGKTPFNYLVQTEQPWVNISSAAGTIEDEKRIWISIDWTSAEKGVYKVPVIISDHNNKEVVIHAVVNNQSVSETAVENCFIESNGYISIEAVNFTGKSESPNAKWQIIPNLGRTESAITALPVTAANLQPGEKGASLEYNLYFFSEGEVNIQFYFSPTQNFGYTDGLRFGYSLDDEAPKIINLHEGDTPDWKYPDYWNRAVGNNIRINTSQYLLGRAGRHVLKFWGIDGGIVLQKIVMDTGGLKKCYLGPPQSYNSKFVNNN